MGTVKNSVLFINLNYLAKNTDCQRWQKPAAELIDCYNTGRETFDFCRAESLIEALNRVFVDYNLPVIPKEKEKMQAELYNYIHDLGLAKTKST